MTENPLERLMNQIADFIDLIKKYENQPLDTPIPPEVKEQLAQLEAQSELFAEIQQKMFNQAGITPDEVSKMIEEGSKAKKEYFFQLSKNLERDAREMHTNIASVIRQREQQPKGKDEEQEAIKARKKKFKKLGGKKGWIPL